MSGRIVKNLNEVSLLNGCAVEMYYQVMTSIRLEGRYLYRICIMQEYQMLQELQTSSPSNEDTFRRSFIDAANWVEDIDQVVNYHEIVEPKNNVPKFIVCLC